MPALPWLENTPPFRKTAGIVSWVLGGGKKVTAPSIHFVKKRCGSFLRRGVAPTETWDLTAENKDETWSSPSSKRKNLLPNFFFGVPCEFGRGYHPRIVYFDAKFTAPPAKKQLAFRPLKSAKPNLGSIFPFQTAAIRAYHNDTP